MSESADISALYHDGSGVWAYIENNKDCSCYVLPLILLPVPKHFPLIYLKHA